MTTPQWLESEAQRVRRERWQARIEGVAGIALGAGLFVVTIRVILALVR